MGLVTIDADAVAELATSTAAAAAEVRNSALWCRPPIKFDSICEELDYMALASLLDFGSAHDALLVKNGFRSAHEAVSFAMLGLAMQGSLPSATAMAEFTRSEVIAAFNVNASVDSELMPGVTITSPDKEAARFLSAMQTVINETGQALLDLDDACSSSLGAFVLKCVDEREAAGLRPSAAALVESLATAIPAFDDVCDVEDISEKSSSSSTRVVLHRKAQQLASTLYLRFCKSSDARFDFEDVDEMSMDSGAEMVSILMEKNVLKVREDVKTAIDGGEDFASKAEVVVALRAAAVEAGRQVCAAAAASAALDNNNTDEKEIDVPFAPRQLSAYLLREGRSAGGTLKKHINSATVAY